MAESTVGMQTAALWLPNYPQILKAKNIPAVIANAIQLYIRRVTSDNGVVKAKSKLIPRENSGLSNMGEEPINFHLHKVSLGHQKSSFINIPQMFLNSS